SRPWTKQARQGAEVGREKMLERLYWRGRKGDAARGCTFQGGAVCPSVAIITLGSERRCNVSMARFVRCRDAGHAKPLPLEWLESMADSISTARWWPFPWR